MADQSKPIASKPIASMTGFARLDGGDGATTWSWEIKSVNGRNLDVRSRLPNGYERLDAVVRAKVPDYCSRGSVQIALTVSRPLAPVKLQVNRDILDQLIALINDLKDEIESAPPRLDGLLAVRGVIETIEEEDTAEALEVRTAAMEADLLQTLAALSETRREEGKRLLAIVGGQLAAFEKLLGAAGDSAAVQPENLRERLRSQVETLLSASPALPEERLAQEVAVLVTKADVREEMDRLQAHLDSARDLLAQGGPVGRRLDFLCQEFNREANTLCAKSPDVALTAIGLDMKSTIDQLREQIQNIE